MHWVSECVRFPMHSLMTEPLFPIAPRLSSTKVPTVFQSQVSFLFNITRLVSPVWAPGTLRRTSAIVLILLFMCCLLYWVLIILGCRS